MKTIFTLIFLSVLPLAANAIQYVKGTSKISPEDFDKCSTKVFRKIAQDELSPENRRLAVKDALIGKAINDIEPLKIFLGQHPDTCSYIGDSEKL
jgi:hypothetical protein